MNKIKDFLSILTPGIIIAMAGVGVGDLATASFAGSALGTTVLWAVVLGAFMKFFITEGCARWQLVTKTTILEGCITKLGNWFRVPFIAYFVLWSYFVSAALISAAGVAAASIFPVFGEHSSVIFSILHSIIAGLIVWVGGFRLFAKVMEYCAMLLFITVMISLLHVGLDISMLKGLFVPEIPLSIPNSVDWTVALIGGVGGTLTVICYGYWIKEVGRKDTDQIKTCRIDLGVGYFLTALFGMAMVILGSKITSADGRGLRLLINIAEVLETQSGRWVALSFLIGAWGAVFSSMLGVWQSAPYILADFVSRGKAEMSSAQHSKMYRLWLLFIVFVPMLSLMVNFSTVQRYYSYFGALVVPFLTIILLYLGRKKFLGEHCNKPVTVVTGALILAFFAYTIVGMGIIPS